MALNDVMAIASISSKLSVGHITRLSCIVPLHVCMCIIGETHIVSLGWRSPPCRGRRSTVHAALSPLHCAPVQGKRCLLLRKSIHCTRNHPVSYNIDKETSELLTQESSEELLMLCTNGCLSCKTLSVQHNFLDFRF